MDFELVCENMTGTVTDPQISTGYGSTTYQTTSGYYGNYQQYANASVRSWSNQGYLVITRATGAPSGPSAFRLFFYTAGSSTVQITGESSIYGVCATLINGAVVMSSGPLTAIKVTANTGNISCTANLRWVKNNV